MKINFTLYYEIFRLIDTIKPKQKRNEFLGKIIDYYFKNEKPKIESNSYEEVIWINIEKPLNAYKAKVANGSKGGRPKKEQQENEKTESKTETLTENKTKKESKKESESKTTTVVNVYVNNNVNVNYILDLIKDFKNISTNEKIKNKIFDWLNYKLERNDKYTDRGIKSLLTRIDNLLDMYNEQTILELIDNSIVNNWKGIIWDKLNTNQAKESNNIPNWLNKENISEDASIEEQNEVKQMLSEFNYESEVRHAHTR